MAYLIPYTLLAQGIYSGLIGTISTVTIGACSVIKSIYTHQNPDATKFIKELDIERRLKLVEAVLNAKHYVDRYKYTTAKLTELESSQVFELISSRNTDVELTDPIELCLSYVHEIVNEINGNLSDIERKVAYHKTKWFSNWRALNIKAKLDLLKLNSDVLNVRFRDLMEISRFLANK